MEDLDPEPRISTYKRDYKPFKVVVLDPDTMRIKSLHIIY